MASKSFCERRNKMNRKLLELLDAINEKKLSIRNLVEAEKMEDVTRRTRPCE